jgi:hypothetical protein
MLLNLLHFVWRAFPMFPGLIDYSGREQLRRIEFAHRKAVEPCLLAARQAMKLRPPDIPQLNVHAVRTALAEENDGQTGQCSLEANKKQKSRLRGAYAESRLRGRPPLAPLAFAAAAFAFDRLRPPRRPVAAANRRVPNARSTNPGT